VPKPDVEIRLVNPGGLIDVIKRVVARLTKIGYKPNKMYVYADTFGRLETTESGTLVRGYDGDSYVGSVTYRRKQNVFVLRGWQVAGMLDEFIEVFQQLGHRCVYEPPEETDAKV
jgi:hypothetical protein